MTASQLLEILGRRWYAALAVLMLTGYVFSSLLNSGGAYTAEAEVVFVSPGDDAVGTFDDRNREALVTFAAVIEREINNGRPSDRMAETAPLYGAGVKQGYRALVPNAGGQWQYNFDRPVLSLTVVGPTAEWVQSRLSDLIERVGELAHERQHQIGIPRESYITIDSVPNPVVVTHLGSTASTQARALVALSLVGLLLASLSAVAVDRLGRHRLNRQRSVLGPPSTTAPEKVDNR